MTDLSVGDPSGEPVAELVTFQCKEGYVYVPLPPATSYGHRAELWNPDKWFKAVRVKVVTCGDNAFVKLEDQDTGELFAECPLPNDGTSLTTAVEPVVDSSRYFVIKVVDRATPKKHAFIGLGFRERGEASDFAAALDDYRQFLRRMREAEQMRQQYDQEQQQQAEEGEGGQPGSSGAPSRDLSLKEPIKLSLNSSGSSKGKALGKLSQKALAVGTQEVGGMVLLQPPPPGGSSSRAGGSSQLSSSGRSSSGGDAGVAAAVGRPLAAVSNPGTPAGSTATAGEGFEADFSQLAVEERSVGSTPAAAPAAGAGQGEGAQQDDWGDFVG